MAQTPPTTPTSPTLLSPDDFKNPAYIIEQPGRNQKYVVTTLLHDLQLFRGDHEGKRRPSTAVPAYFADATSAYIYTRGDPDKLSAYKVIKQPKLFVLSYKNILNLSEEEELEPDEKAALDMYFQIDLEKKIPYIVPIGFLKRENAMGEHKLYLNRRILTIVCRLGYDGWIAMPNTLLQRNMDARHYQQTGELRFNYNPYNPEIAICHWQQFLEAI